MSNFAADYVDVAERIRLFRDLYPEGSLRPASLERPFWIEDVPNVGPRLVYVAAAYRHPEDPAPGIGSAWEPLPGKTPYTRDSELMVAEGRNLTCGSRVRFPEIVIEGRGISGDPSVVRGDSSPRRL